jgi:hypothetical protein
MPTMEVVQCPSWAAALGYMGVASAVCLSNWGSAVRCVLLVLFLFVLYSEKGCCFVLLLAAGGVVVADIVRFPRR